jgi:hypothetical protein
MRSATGSELIARLRELELLKEETVHIRGIVLARMDHEEIESVPHAIADAGRELDDLRTRAEDEAVFHLFDADERS